MMKKILVASLLVIAYCTSTAYAQYSKYTPPCGVFSEVSSERQYAYDQIIEQRTITIQYLISSIEIHDLSKRFEGPLHRAIDLLGKFRAKEAIDTLKKLLMYVPENYVPEEDLPSEFRYVAAVALVDIGEPSIYAMLSRITDASTKEERDLAAWVIMEIEGTEQALHRMNTMILERANKDIKDKFESAKKFIETYEPRSWNPLLQSDDREEYKDEKENQ